jgi:hypothetical protein
MSARPMLARIPTALLAFILSSMVPLHGQDQPPRVDATGPIAKARPAVTNSSVVVPSGSLQVENGFPLDRRDKGFSPQYKRQFRGRFSER